MRGQEGSATWMAAAAGTLAAVMLAGLGLVVEDVRDATMAQTAADAAALAAVGDGSQSAHGMASRNGGSIVGSEVGPGRATVSVRVGDIVRSAAAERPLATQGVGDRRGLAPAMVAALARAEELLGVTIPIVSGYRSPAQQQALWDRRHENPYPVARPGTSRHELGLAIDVPLNVVEPLRRVANAAGLCHPLPESDPVHFVVCPIRP